MLDHLSATLKAILDHASAPAVVRAAEVAFDRPAESYNPDKTTINLFLYDVRENTESRSNEPVVEWNDGIATIRTPPVRVACSYLVTVWIDSSAVGDQAMLDQHRLLGEVLRVFSRLTTIDDKYLQGDLKTQMYPVPLVSVHGDLMKNPAEFWSALGGKLRPSITLTAIIALEPNAEVMTAPQVSSRKILLNAEPVIAIGGTVRDETSGSPIASVDLLLVELGLYATSDQDGRFQFPGLPPGNYSIRAVKQGYSAKTSPVGVPGTSATAFDVVLSTSP